MTRLRYATCQDDRGKTPFSVRRQQGSVVEPRVPVHVLLPTRYRIDKCGKPGPLDRLGTYVEGRLVVNEEPEVRWHWGTIPV